jgi:hypothetical protein
MTTTPGDLYLKPICLAALGGDQENQARLVDAIRASVNKLEDAGMVYLGAIVLADQAGYLRPGELDQILAGARDFDQSDWFRFLTPLVRGAVLDEEDDRALLAEMVGERILDLEDMGEVPRGTLRYIRWEDRP